MGLPFAEMEKTVGVVTVENQMLILAVFTLKCRLNPHMEISRRQQNTEVWGLRERCKLEI